MADEEQVQVKTRDGSLWMIPKANLSAAQARGAVLVQPSPTQSRLQRAYEGVGHGFKKPFDDTAKLVHDLAAPGLVGLAMNPAKRKAALDAAKSLLTVNQVHSMITHPLETAFDIRRDAKGNVDWPSTIGASAGKAGALYLMGKGMPGSGEAEGAAEASKAVAKPSIPRKVVRALTGTGERQTREFVKEIAEKNAESERMAQEKNAKAVREAREKTADAAAKAVEARKETLRKYYEETQKAKAANFAPIRAMERKQGLTAGVQKLSSEIGEGLRLLDKKVRAEASSKYETVKASVAGESVPRQSLADIVQSAESKYIKGSSESLKVFRDILNKSGEEEVELGGAAAGGVKKGHPLYEQLVSAGIIPEADPVTFADLQGYYTELGEKLSNGNLPGDVYQAMKAVQNSIGEMMQQMADRRGVGPQLTDARNFYRQYMETFRDRSGPNHSGSPVAMALKAKDPAFVLRPFEGGSGDRGIEMLAKYDPILAQKLNTTRGYQAQTKGGVARALTVPKPMPKLEPASPGKVFEPKRINPEIARVGIEELEVAKGAELRKMAKKVGTTGTWLLPFTALHSVMGFLTGDLHMAALALADIPVYMTGREMIVRALEKPAFVKWVGSATPGDIKILDTLPPEYRQPTIERLRPVVEEATRRKMRVSPALLYLVSRQREKQSEKPKKQ